MLIDSILKVTRHCKEKNHFVMIINFLNITQPNVKNNTGLSLNQPAIIIIKGLYV